MSSLRADPDKAPINAYHRVAGQAGLTHPRHVHPRAKRPAGNALRKAVNAYNAEVDARGLKAEIASMATPHKLSRAGLGWLFEAMFGAKN